ncbi:hypothetical protein CASFOL_007856 [Castilleja foliolosa]|uniref:RNA polymerase Rpb2 domain-containing protein n=1 Tax=Castilleja foliolosa TaxID=1961234 RepID=A0ABD3E2A4_9LAMI
MQEQTILIGNIPLMNSLGTSIVNGIYRIVINQILQSPGIYYRSELDHNGISVYTGTIISDWGGRSELEIDRKDLILYQICRFEFLEKYSNFLLYNIINTIYSTSWIGLVSLVPSVVPIPVMFLGLFTSGIQALIFATLAAAYIGESMEGHH